MWLKFYVYTSKLWEEYNNVIGSTAKLLPLQNDTSLEKTTNHNYILAIIRIAQIKVNTIYMTRRALARGNNGVTLYLTTL